MITTRRSFDPIAPSARAVRSLVRRSLAGRDDMEVEVVVLLTSELATNAIVHAVTSFDVEVRVEHDAVRVDVEDRRRDRPLAPRRAGDAATSGRGIAIVAAVADRWGCEETAEGKRVWFELHARRPGSDRRVPDGGPRSGPGGGGAAS